MSITTIGFSGRGAKRPSAALLRRVRLGMGRDGAVAFAGLFPLALLKRLRSWVLRRHKSGELRENGLVRDIAGRYAAVLPFTGPFLEPRFYANPALRALLGALLGPDYCIGSLETVIAEPGAGRQHQHIDGPVRFDRIVGGRKVPYKGDLSGLPPYAVTLAIPLCAVTQENGPTAVWKGSHRAALRARPPGAQEVGRRYPVQCLSVPFGGAYLFDFRVFHGGMPNGTPEPRPVLMFVFTRAWYRDPNQNEVFPSVVISKRDLEKVPPKHRSLFMLAPAARRRLWADRRRAG